jgi:hypothetical protein
MTQIARFPVKGLDMSAALGREASMTISAEATTRPKMALIAPEFRLAMPFLTFVGTPKTVDG